MTTTTQSLYNEVNNTIKDTEKTLSKKVKVFPTDVFPKQIEENIKDTNRTLGFPIDFAACSALSALAAAIGNTYKAKVKNGYTQPATLYIAIIGSPGTNKSQPVTHFLAPLNKRNKEGYEQFQKEYKDYKLKLRKLKKGEPEPKEPKLTQYIVSDVTIEAVIQVHSSNPRGVIVYVDELAGFIKSEGRYNGGGDTEFWLSNFSGTTVTVNRKTSGSIQIPYPSISIIGTIQPKILEQSFKDKTDNGYVDRILCSFPDNLKKEFWTNEELSIDTISDWEKIIFTLLDHPFEYSKYLPFSKEAYKRLFEWQKWLTNKTNSVQNDSIKGIYSKMELYCIRFALILEISKYACQESSAEEISLHSVEGAIKLTDYFISTALKVNTIIYDTNPVERLTMDKQNLYNALPPVFRTGDGVKLSIKMGISERTFKNFINNKNLFLKPKTGHYEKLF